MADRVPATTVAGEDWSLDDLAARVFEDVLIRDVDASETTSTSGTAFTDCVFREVRFNLAEYTVRGGDWSFVGLAGADLRNASFEDARMREADLSGTRCSGAKLVNLDLAGASFDRGDFERCDLRGSDLSSMDPWTVKLGRAIVDWQQAVTLASGMGLDVRAD